jgi:CPA1 family monovalent cation:H+ antiporter
VHNVEAVLGLVVLAIGVAAVADRLRTPAPSVLVVVGLGVGFLPGLSALHVSPKLVTLGVLPPLLFSAAQQISLIDLRRVWRPVAALAVGLVAITAIAVAAVAHAVSGAIAGTVALTFGAVLASTDPVAVSALSRDLRLPERVRTLVQAESLFNDATSLVLFEVAVLGAVRGHVGAGEAITKFVTLGVGGAALGVATGWVSGLALRHTHEPTVQAALALVTPYVAAVAADAADVSPVTAVIVAGIMLGRRRVRTRHSGGRLVAGSVYEVVVFVLENAIFAVIGLELASFIRALPHEDRTNTVVLLVVVTFTLLLVRALALAVTALLPRLMPPRKPAVERPAWQIGAVVTWAGARGVIPLAAALSIPTRTDAGAPFPHRPLILVVATGVVVVTLVVQGTTLAPLVRRLGVATPASDLTTEVLHARHELALAAIDQLDALSASVGAPASEVDRLRTELQQQADTTQAHLADDGADSGAAARLRARVLAVQAEELARLRVSGRVSADGFRHVQRQLDLEQARLRE